MPLTAVVLAALLSSTAAPAKVVYDFDALSQTHIQPPPLRTIEGVGAITYTIHATTEHDSHNGTQVKVWMSTDSPTGAPGVMEVQRSCAREPGCEGPLPSKAIVQSLFDDALNDLLLNNESGFGRYSIERCDKLEKPHGWLMLMTSVMVALDSHLVYKIRTGPASLLNYALKVGTTYQNRYGYAKFGPPPPQSRSDAIEYIWSMCGDPKKRSSIGIVTQVDVRRLTEDSLAKPAKKM